MIAIGLSAWNCSMLCVQLCGLSGVLEEVVTERAHRL